MTRGSPMRPAHPFIPLVLAALAGCSDAMAPSPGPDRPQFAQGDGGLWTVNVLDDAGDGTCDDTCTLRDAIDDAADGDEIVFAGIAGGTLLLASGQLEIIDKSLLIDGEGRVTIDAQGGSRILWIEDAAGSGEMLVRLFGLDFQNGAVTGDPDDDKTLQGGAIRISGADVVMEDVSVLDSSTPATGGGVAVLDEGSLSLDLVIIARNNSTLQGGGGLVVTGSSLSMANTILADNGTGGEGAGLRIVNSTVTVTGSTISGNVAEVGGGVWQSGGTLAAALSTISGNRADAVDSGMPTGGGMTLNAGIAQLSSVTITGNAAFDQGFASGNSLAVASGATLTISNSIVGGGGNGIVPGCVYSLGATVTSGGYNILGTDCATAAPPASDIIIDPGFMYTQVLDANLGYHGGFTDTHAIFAAGLAADAGFCPSESSDQRGLTRPVDLVAANAADGCDIGAFEVQLVQDPLADLAISQAVNKTSVKQGELLTYTVRVRNFGPQTAENVVVSDVLSGGVTFVEARVNRGSTTTPLPGETGTVTWSVGDMQDGDDEIAEIVVTVLVRGKTTITNTASASSDTDDPNADNNSASITVTVASGSGGGAKGGKGGPNK